MIILVRMKRRRREHERILGIFLLLDADYCLVADSQIKAYSHNGCPHWIYDRCVAGIPDVSYCSHATIFIINKFTIRIPFTNISIVISLLGGHNDKRTAFTQIIEYFDLNKR